MPIDYGITVPSVAMHPDQGRAFVRLLTGPEGAAVLRAEGFTPISPPAATGSVPSDAIGNLNHPLFFPPPCPRPARFRILQNIREP